MTDQLWIDHVGGIVVFLTILLLISLVNLLTLKRLGQFSPPSRFPRVSLLLPARNEARNIEACTRSLLGQDYPDFEVIVLDDESTDGTGEILRRLAPEEARLRVIQGLPLPAGWLGKNWACHQLAQAATGDYLLFTDADTRHTSTMLRDAIAAALATQADLLSGLPRQEVKTWSEQLLVPLLAWSFMAFIPLALAERLPAAFLSISIGQFLLFRRSAYAAIKGHASVRHQIVEDFALTRHIKRAGLRWRFVDATPRIHCRMYQNFREVFAGLSKNLFVIFGNLFFFAVAWIALLLAFLEPPLILLLALLGLTLPSQLVGLSILAIGQAILLWGITDLRFGFPRKQAVFYPITIGLSIVIGLRSLVAHYFKRGVTWKGRAVSVEPEA
ncbi:chlorobactene glucosyltransferase [Thermoflexales bacterium]|nr:chlorobactene glucosyltransferase [Thermoflexales bacterium]